MNNEAVRELAEFISYIDFNGHICESMTCVNYNDCTECVIDYLKEKFGLEKEN